MTTIKNILFTVLCLCLLSKSATVITAEESEIEKGKIAVGAIRWDAWSGGSVTAQVERSLGPAKYRDRLPWFAEVIDDNQVRINGGNQETMDQEIDFAAEAGLGYWAFVMYPESDSMSRSLRLYLDSNRRSKIKFCLILHNNISVRGEDWQKERDRVISLLKEPTYQTVLNGRPLVYFFGANPQRFQDLRQTLIKEGLNPYYVYMGWNPPKDYEKEKPNGFDAVSAYANGNKVKTFAELAQAAELNWQRAAEAGIQYIPLVTAGWDKQPRKDHPVSWEKNDAYHQQDFFPSQAKPHEIAQHLRRAIEFSQSRREICPAKAIIMYAWNENDEGGWLIPTWQENGKPNTKRLDAIREILKPQ